MNEKVEIVRPIPKFSLVVPVYKTEKYIRTCLDSILSQQFKDFELILIDDGSPDHCGDICNEYAKQDARVRVFHQENRGVSEARNLGIEKARGEWISFIDSDDYIDKDYFEACLEDENVDLIYFGFTACFEEGSRTSYFLSKDLPNDYIYFLKKNQQKYCHFGYTWNKFFKLDIIKNHHLCFCANLSMHEDELFTLQYCEYVKTVRTSLKAGYFYRVLTTGLTGVFRKNAEEFELLADKYSETISFLTKTGKAHLLYVKEVYMLYLHACIIASNIHYRWNLCCKLRKWSKQQELDLNYFGRTERKIVKYFSRTGNIGFFISSIIMKRINLERWI